MMSNNEQSAVVNNDGNNFVMTGPARCQCGYQRGDLYVRANLSYGLMGLFGLLSVGMSSVPKRVDWQCIRCKDIVQTITDPAELKRYRYRIPKN